MKDYLQNIADRRISRRTLLGALPAITGTWPVIGQPGAAPIPARKLNQMTLVVSDLQRPLEFYQGLFGMPVQARQGSTVLLRVGKGPQFLALQPAEGNTKPGYSHFGLAVNGFNADWELKVLTEHGVRVSEDRGPMTARIRRRGLEEGGAKKGTPQLFLDDPDYRATAGHELLRRGRPAGERLSGAGRAASQSAARADRPEPLHDLRGRGGARAAVLSRSLRTLHSGAPGAGGAAIWSGSGDAIPHVRGRRRARGRAGLRKQHQSRLFCDGRVQSGCRVEGAHWLRAKAERRCGRTPAPLQHYVTLRMENRGGSPHGTPELYFTDPDGILVQIQNVRYCGGAGKLGEVCKG